MGYSRILWLVDWSELSADEWAKAIVASGWSQATALPLPGWYRLTFTQPGRETWRGVIRPLRVGQFKSMMFVVRPALRRVSR